MNGNLSRLCREAITFDANEIADVEQFFEYSIVKRFVFFGTEVIPADIDLNATSLVLQFNK